jgi:hypothetical protein
MHSAMSDEEILWRARAGAVARRVNLGWWWQRLAPALIGINLAGAGGLLLFRQLRWSLWPMAWIFIGGWVVAAGWAWWRARARFYAEAEGLLRLETYLGWHNVLSAAAAGGVRWPAVPEESLRVVEWRWGTSAQPLLASLAFLLAGLFVPVGVPPKPYLPPPAQLPLSVQEVQKWTDALKEQKLIEPAMMETWEQRLEQLKNKPAQDWYGQESLEAAESLHNQMAKELDTMGKNLQKASDLLGSMQSLPSNSAASNELNNALGQQAANLENSGLPLRQDLDKQIADAKSLTPEQMADLKKKLEQAASALSAMSAANAFPGQFGLGTTSAASGLPNPYSTGNASAASALPNPYSLGDATSASGLPNPYNLGSPATPGMPGLPSSGAPSPGSSGPPGAPSGSSPGSVSVGSDGPGQAGPHGESPGSAVGSGGPGGGGGSGGLTYEAPTDLRALNKVGETSKNQQNTQPGDMIALSKSAPPKNSNNEAVGGSGGAAGQGGGGDAVWRQELTPQERAKLNRYFK